MHRKSIVKIDSAIGIVFSMLFAFGILLMVLFVDHVDLDLDCVLYGELGLIANHPRAVGVPIPVLVMGGVLTVTAGVILLFYKELLVSSFDPGLAGVLGFHPVVIHYITMALLSVIVVSAFQAVGAILVIAMLILPGATAYLLSKRLKTMLALSTLHALLSTLGGIHLGVWLNCSLASAMVVAGAFLFFLTWLFYPQGLLRRWITAVQQRKQPENRPPEENPGPPPSIA
ncbi:MAG: metal ABC transporter permease [Verrucomicrobiota bacterium]